MSKSKERPKSAAREKRELALAEMIANSEALGLAFCTGSTGVSLNRRENRWDPDDNGDGCCAIGAYLACKASPSDGRESAYTDFRRLTGLAPNMIFRGNDAVELDTEWSDPDEAVGVAFRAYHTVHG